MTHIFRILLGFVLIVVSYIITFVFVEFIKPHMAQILKAGLFISFLYVVGWIVERKVKDDEEHT